MLMLSSAGYQPDPPATPDSQQRFRQIMGWPGLENRRPLAGAGTKPFTLTPPPQAANDPLNITCTLLLYNAECETRSYIEVYEVFSTFARYVKHKIEATWNTPDPGKPDMPSNPGISSSRTVRCTINVKPVTVNHGVLGDGEVFIAVKRGGARSFIEGDHRAGVFYINDADYRKFLGIKKATKPEVAFRGMDLWPAHEFGHVLGLDDRYAYLCYFHEEASGTRWIITDRGHTVPLYIHSTGTATEPAYADTEYAENYAWLFNLMSTKATVPGSADPAPRWDAHDTERNNSVTVLATKHYQDTKVAINPDSTAILPSGAVFVSKAQLDCIASGQKELLPGAGHIFFKKIPDWSQYLAGNHHSYVFKGTFVGIIPDASNDGSGVLFHVVHDDNYDTNWNSSTSVNPIPGNNPQVIGRSVDGNMRYRCRVIQSLWNDNNPPPAASLAFASGLLDASLDLRILADQFAANVKIGGDVVPLEIMKLLDVEHLDHPVCIRRYVGNDVQSRLDSHANYRNPNVTALPAIRAIANDSLNEIRAKDSEFTPPRDLFADDQNLTPLSSTATPLSLDGLFVPYSYSIGGTIQFSTRPGKTLFYTGAPPPGPGVPVKIVDSHRLFPRKNFGQQSSTPAGWAGWVYGLNNAEITAISVGIWDAKKDLPDHSMAPMVGISSLNWSFQEYILDYDASFYPNRKTLVALVKNGALKPDIIVNSKITTRFGLDPARYSLDKCFTMRWITYREYIKNGVNQPLTSASSTNTNTAGRYLVLRYRKPEGH